MKKILFAFSFILFLAPISTAQDTIPAEDSRKIQVAILFDTSNSMDGLIDQAKSKIWNIVNEIASLTYDGQTANLEIAIYEYGNDGLDATGNYIRQVLDLSTDLDEISQKLFGLRTNGGSEYCGAVIGKSLDDLAWSNLPTDLKMIYIAGNEPFNQGPIDYKETCKSAHDRSIYINTIYCGNYEQGIKEFWLDGSIIGEGDYFNIDSDKAIAHISSPYDSLIQVYNDSLNKTYYGYGIMGNSKKALQVSEDHNAAAMDMEVMTERTIAKSKKGAYRNDSWDIVDAVEGGKDINEIDEKELPEEFKGLTSEEKEAKVVELSKDREKYQKEIEKLAIDRQKFVDEERKKLAAEGEEDDFGSSVNKSINKKANAIGFEKVVTP